MAAQIFQIAELIVGFHAFSDDFQLQPMGHGDDGVDDASAVLAAADGLDEGLVHFQCVDGQSVQVVQGGIPGAEVINGDTNPGICQLFQFATDLFQIVHDDVFSDLNL